MSAGRWRSWETTAACLVPAAADCSPEGSLDAANTEACSKDCAEAAKHVTLDDKAGTAAPSTSQHTAATAGFGSSATTERVPVHLQIEG
jgi:hypothetical protein